MESQQQIDFAPPKRKRAASKTSLANYTKALDYLRDTLSPIKFTPIHPHEIAKRFGISGGFMDLVFRLGGVYKEYLPEHRCTGYIVAHNLYGLTAEQLLRKGADLHAERKTDVTEPAQGPVSDTLTIVSAETQQELDAQNPTIYMAGVASGDTIQFTSSLKVYSLEEAKAQCGCMYVRENEKIVIVQVLEVMAPVRSFQPATL